MTDLALSITSADGRVTRWGAGEADARSIPSGLTFSTSVPGGFKDLSCGLLRDYQLDHPDQALLDSVRVYGPGNRTAWEGRMVQFPAQRGASRTISPGAVGWAAHLKDDPSFREIYVDRDLNRWQGPSTARQAQVLAGTPAYKLTDGDMQVASDPSGTPAVILSMSHVATTLGSIGQTAEAWYDATGISIGSVYYDQTQYDLSNAKGQLGANWQLFAGLFTDDTFSGSTLTANLAGTASTGTLSATATNQDFAALQMYYAQTATVDGEWRTYWRRLAVFGGHGLTKRGTAPSDGFYASDVIADIVSRAAPLLTYSTGAGGSIESTTFVIPHLVFADPVTAEDAISLVNGYHLYEWGVWENREFFWRAPDPDRLTWQARLADGAKIDLEGDDANNIFNGVYLTYSDPSGRKKTAGPPGSGADTEDASLVDTSPDNPVNRQGIPRRWARLDISQVTTPAGAVQIGAVYLAEKSLPSRRGTMTLTGTVNHPTKGRRPVWEMRAGDYVQLTDRPDDPVRRVIETRYDHDSLTVTLSLDNTVMKLDALFERLGAGLIGVL